MKRALITGVTGQDGAYLSEFLLAKGYEVHGIKRRASSFNTDRVDHLYQDLHDDSVTFRLHYGDLTDSTNLIRIIQEVQPDEIYNLGAQSHVMVSFETPEYTANTDAMGTLRLLEAIRILKMQRSSYTVPPRARAFLNPGSVGQPRDGDPAAAYALFEPERRRFTVHRVPYDVVAVQRKVHQVGYPASLAERLERGR